MYIGALGQILGVDAVLCTDLESSEEGIYTGRLNGPNVRGPEKTRVLRDWLLISDVTIEQVVLHAYGDSAGDDELLRAAGRNGHDRRRPGSFERGIL